ncbi:MAG TPA: glycosyltransferase family 4 protein [Pyrinomonadaceae bacterium]|nr:glycosyltransferase family 4 protein [Pyrinomonadaceae bacterium]
MTNPKSQFRNPKSVHLTNYYHKNSGGISTAYNDLLAAAERHQRFVSLIVPGEADEVEQVNPFAKIYYIKAPNSPIFDKRYRIILPWQFLPNDSKIRQIMLDEKPDLVEVCDKYSLSLVAAMIRRNKFLQLGRPMLVNLVCERMDDNLRSYLTKSKIGKWFSNKFISHYNFPLYDFHIANSHYTTSEFNESLEANRKSLFLNYCWKFFKASQVAENERIFVCPCGVNFEYFAKNRKSDEVKKEMRQKVNIPPASIVLLYAGRISPEKNIGLLLELMKVLAQDTKQDFRLLVAGGGPKVDWLKSETEQHIPNKIIQLGHLEKEILAKYYANADVFVHPNPHEPFGIGPLEAMASRVPVVAPNSGGVLSYATNENAWLAEPNSKNFAAAIREIIENSELKEQKIAKAFETAKANSRERSTDLIFATYDKLFADFQNRKELFVD